MDSKRESKDDEDDGDDDQVWILLSTRHYITMCKDLKTLRPHFDSVNVYY